MQITWYLSNENKQRFEKRRQTFNFAYFSYWVYYSYIFPEISLPNQNGNLLKLRNEIKIERIKALKAFKKDSITGKFPGKKQSSNLEKKEFEEFINQLD